MTAVEQRAATREPALWNLVGNTPLVPVEFDGNGQGRLWLKAEWLNPGGSVKDRAARAILRAGIAAGHLPAKRLLDASSGNTGIAYAMLGAAAGVQVTICLPGNASPERWALLKVYGAEVVVTDRMDGTEGAAKRARELADDSPDKYYYADQYSNQSNPRAHYETTGPELWSQTGGQADALRRGHGHHGNHDGHRPLLEGEEPGDHVGRACSPTRRFTDWKGSSTCRPRRTRRRSTTPPSPTGSPRFRPRRRTAPRAGWRGNPGCWSAGRPAPRWRPRSTCCAASPMPRWS